MFQHILQILQVIWWLDHFPGQCVPVYKLFGEFFPLNIQSKSPLLQPEAIFFSSVTYYLGEEENIHLVITSFQIVVESDKVPTETNFLQAGQFHLHCPFLVTLQHLRVFLIMKGSKLNGGFEVWSSTEGQSLSCSC